MADHLAEECETSETNAAATEENAAKRMPSSAAVSVLDPASPVRPAYEEERPESPDRSALTQAIGPTEEVRPSEQTGGSSDDAPDVVSRGDEALLSRRRDILLDGRLKSASRKKGAKTAKDKGEALGRRYLEDTGLGKLAAPFGEVCRANIKADALLHASLAPLLDLDAVALVSRPGFKEACMLRKAPFTAGTKRNPDNALIGLLYPDMDRKRRSRCARALAYARREGVTGDAFTKFAAENGGIEGCCSEAVLAKRTSSRSLRLVVTDAPTLQDGDYAMVVRVEGRRAVFVREATM